jgi:glycosyltransferase involved in cell wall biosynthesis
MNNSARETFFSAGLRFAWVSAKVPEMKVAFLLQDTRALYGAEQATVRLVKGLVAAGVAVRVLLLHETRLGGGASPLVNELRQLVPVTEIPVRGRFSREAIGQIREFVARERVDIIHSTGYKADWHAGIASKWATLFPVVSTVHGWLFRWNLKERFFQALNIRALRQFSRVVVLCDFYERYLRRCGLSPLQLAKIPTGLRADAIASRAEARLLWETPGEVFTFGLLGRLSSEKNHELLLRAAVRLARDLETSPRSWRILIAGDGPLRGKLRKSIERFGLSDRVTLAGRMEPRDFFPHVHVLVQCSRVENQPMSVMEAMAWMRPVIATRAGGLPELVHDGDTGYLVQNNHARALATAMKACLISPEQVQAAGLRARDRLERDYPFDLMIRDTIGLYGAALIPH